jgi:metal-sulfur cluster biosynthetic enzyme
MNEANEKHPDAANPAVSHESKSAGEAAPASHAEQHGVGESAAASTSATEAPSQQELAIRSALETVMDPEIGLSVIDLGLIREVKIEPGKTLVRMMLTTPFCPYAPQMVADVKQATESALPQPCEVELMPDAWSPDLMPDPGLLGYSF